MLPTWTRQMDNKNVFRTRPWAISTSLDLSEEENSSKKIEKEETFVLFWQEETQEINGV